MKSCDNKKNIFETLEFSHKFPKVKEFAYMLFCKEGTKIESDRISGAYGK